MRSVQIKINNTTISIKEYILDHYSNYFLKSPYQENSKFINEQIRDLTGDYEKKDLSQRITKFLIDTIMLDKEMEKSRKVQSR